mmetsp:Transcript_33842/g.75039  ORF Transcript_33842/g.75039 Transcript_33842/m.75039 type:complete len:251 (-) Transcript_33842:408-1160(-)
MLSRVQAMRVPRAMSMRTWTRIWKMQAMMMRGMMRMRKTRRSASSLSNVASGRAGGSGTRRRCRTHKTQLTRRQACLQNRLQPAATRSLSPRALSSCCPVSCSPCSGSSRLTCLWTAWGTTCTTGVWSWHHSGLTAGWPRTCRRSSAGTSTALCACSCPSSAACIPSTRLLWSWCGLTSRAALPPPSALTPCSNWTTGTPCAPSASSSARSRPSLSHVPRWTLTTRVTTSTTSPPPRTTLWRGRWRGWRP